jgi:dienelactone hydrolase
MNRLEAKEREAGEALKIDPEMVTLRSWNPFLVRELKEKPGSSPDFTIQAELYLPPENSGPAPAVLVLEGLGGLKNSRERRYGSYLAEHGLVALVIDSFKSRNAAQYGDLGRAVRVTEAMMTADAFAGLSHLAAHARVRADRVHIIGFSYGGMIAVLTAYEQLAELFLPGGPRFAGHLSYYGCSVPRLHAPKATGAPVSMLLGERDANVSIPRIRAIADDLRRGGSPVEVTVFRDTYHQWDGVDETRRWVPANLARCRMRLSPDYELRDERTGLRARGRASRTAILTIWANPLGYFILRDEEASRRSDEILLNAISAS